MVSSNLSFEEIYPCLRYWGLKLSNRYLDCDDLINSIWLMEETRKLTTNSKHLSLTIKRNMLDYIRSESSCRRKNRLNFISPFVFDSTSKTVGGECNLLYLLSDKSESFSKLDTQDFIKAFSKRFLLNRREILILNLLFINGYNLKVIGTIVGVSSSYVSQIVCRLKLLLKSSVSKELAGAV